MQEAKDLLEELEITYRGVNQRQQRNSQEQGIRYAHHDFHRRRGQDFQELGRSLTAGVLRDQTNAILGQ